MCIPKQNSFFFFWFWGQTYTCMILQLNIISDVWTDAVVDRVWIYIRGTINYINLSSLFIQINYINPHKEDKRPLLTRNVNFVHIHMVYTFFFIISGMSYWMFENWGMIKDEKENRHNETPQKKNKKGIKLWTKEQINNTNWPIL